MATPNFSSILDKPVADVERPLPFPAGSFVGTIKGNPAYDVSSQKKTPYAEFTIVPSAALEGEVDDNEIAAYEAKQGKITTKQQKIKYYLTEASVFMLKDFLKNCGIDVDAGSIREAIDKTNGCEIGFVIKHTPTQDGESMRAEIGRTFAIAD